MRPLQRLMKAPLVEAILEIRWRLSPNPNLPGVAIDPNYKFLVGRFHDRVQTEYKFYEPLPTLTVPDEMVNYTAQHRFRVGEKSWPLVQLGPGVVTLNDTTNYDWEDFERRSNQLVNWLFEAYPDASNNLCILGIQLRYLDAMPFNFETDNILEYMATNLRINISVPQDTFDEIQVSTKPIAIHSVFNFRTTEPVGVLRLQFSRGKRKDIDSLIWETVVHSADQDIPLMPDGFSTWLQKAHTITHNLFFAMIEGPLYERFK